MKTWILTLLIGFLAFTEVDPFRISKINELKKEGESAFKAGNWLKASQKYSYLTDTLEHYEDEVVLNLAHAYLNMKDTSAATGTYQRLATSTNKIIKSQAYQQLGFISTETGKLEISLNLFRESLIANPYNEASRYNYELVKKILNKLNEQEKKKDDLEKPDKPKEPSEYAKELKQQAERLAARFKYKKAIQLMQEGLKVDPTVAYYKDFVQRLIDITQIVESIQ